MEKALAILSKINDIIINPIIILFFAIAFIYFIYGVFEYIWRAKSDPSKMIQGRNHMLSGIFGMFIMISVFGLFQFLLNSFPTGERTKNNVNKILDLD